MAKTSKMCFTHTDRPAETLCTQCHKPLCSDCVIADPDGSFCSVDCLNKCKTFKSGYGGPQKMKGGLVKKLVSLVILLAVIYAILYVGGKMDCGICKSCLKCIPFLPKP